MLPILQNNFIQDVLKTQRHNKNNVSVNTPSAPGANTVTLIHTVLTLYSSLALTCMIPILCDTVPHHRAISSNVLKERNAFITLSLRDNTFGTL
jgi:hypothetical protein